jgi:hypothetical protein
MQLLNRQVVRRVCGFGLLIAICAMAGTRPAGASAAASTPAVIGPVADKIYFPEVRLRKLHLVRPDLIQYPIFYEIYC